MNNPPSHFLMDEEIIVADGSTLSNLETDPDAYYEDESIPISHRGDIILTLPSH